VPGPAASTNDVLIVGAGPAGLGVAAALARVGIDAVVLDRDGIGASFRAWPVGTRLLTPSFTGNQFGLVDLNAITPETSPALSLLDEHPTGEAYARYLAMVAELEGLDVRTGVEVTDVDTDADDDTLLRATTTGGPWRARAVVWAAGEFGYPRAGTFPGAAACVHTATVTDLSAHPGDEVVVIGGAESGIDAAVQLVARGARVTVVDPDAPWAVVDPDPSMTLSPYTHGRLRAAWETGRLVLHDAGVVTEVVGEHGEHGVHHVRTADGSSLRADGPPLLAIGFHGSASLLPDRFKRDEHGRLVVTEEGDASTIVPGLFLAGPMLAHRGAIFCFVYKFRQRFGVVARAVAERLGVDPGPLEGLREHGFLLDDLSCCDDACAC
jgi:putative flavoprotein involved in K+ transport